MDVRLTWTDCDEAGDYFVPNALSPRDLVSRPDNMDETVLHTHSYCFWKAAIYHIKVQFVCELPFLMDRNKFC